MKNKKKILIMVLSCVLISLIVLGIIFLICKQQVNSQQNQNIEIQPENLKSLKLYEKLNSAIDDGYTINIKVDNNNKILIAVKGNKAYEEETYKGKTTKYIVKDGNTYLLSNESKKFYTYQNNTTLLNKVTNTLENMQGCTYTAGTEEIEGKKYNYEQYEDMSQFLINYEILGDDDIGNTKLYFKGNDLKYIKTTGLKGEELSKISINYNVDESLFEIPSDYKDANQDVENTQE